MCSSDLQQLLNDFIAKYPSIVSDAAFKQGDMFDRSAYPDVQDVAQKFRIREFISAVPENDFRNSISSVLADDLAEHYKRQTEAIVNDVMVDAADRLCVIAERISAACTDVTPDEDGGKVRRKKIYENTVNNAKEICEVLKSFNLTNNDALEGARAQLESALRDVTLEDLRESSYIRAKVKDSVDDMLSKFKPLRSFA